MNDSLAVNDQVKLSALLARVAGVATDELLYCFARGLGTFRASNIERVAIDALTLIEQDVRPESAAVAPSLLVRMLDRAAWETTKELQHMWAGLIASAFSDPPDDDGNRIFIAVAETMTRAQFRVLEYMCRNARLFVDTNGLIFSRTLTVPVEVAEQISGLTNRHELDRVLDHFRNSGMLSELEGGFKAFASQMTADITPSAFALNFFVRCSGSRSSPVEFFGAVPGDQQQMVSDQKGP